MSAGTDPRGALLAETERAQEIVSRPDTSAWVSANAGAGKTHVLMMRVLRLLLAGTPPERIMCLTYTKAAAAEMATRVFRRLSVWATLPDDALAKDLTKLTGGIPEAELLRAARQLFARAIEAPGGLKVQTIHAFCERLLQRFPLEARIPPGFSILDDEAAAQLRRDSIDTTLAEANAAPDSELGRALTTCVGWAAEERFETLLGAALNQRAWLADVSLRGTSDDASLTARADAAYRALLGIRQEATADALEHELADVLNDGQILAIAGHLADGGKTDTETAAGLKRALAARDDAQRVALLGDVFLTKTGTPRARLMLKAKAEEAPALFDVLNAAQNAFVKLEAERRALFAVAATVALVVLSDRVMQLYTDGKARRAALDYEDLIVKAADLLQHSDAAGWVLYKLDGGLDHILVDEAQDTSPTQWSVIKALASEFTSGTGSSDSVRTLFAVGDKKQSIYGFQGAAPEEFERTGAQFKAAMQHAGLSFERQPLKLSFRTVAPVLESVDRVFANAAQTPGLTTGTEAVEHIALRVGEAGSVEMWEIEQPEETPAAPAFAPLDEATAPSPVARVATAIADTIKGWLDGDEPLVSQARPIKASDILILVRKRAPFAEQMVRALKLRGVPVAGADQLVLHDQIAVQDLLALGDFLTLPEDDLSLAAVLKSPLCGLTDDDLITFAPKRKGALWSAFLAAADHEPRFQPVAEALKRWRAHADFAPPFEFFATLLDRDGGRARFLERLGPDAGDALDEFMNLALRYDDQAPASLQGFLCWLRDSDRKIKRDMEQGRDQVRVMTAHGAKGLEAPIVFLPDTCSAASGRAPALTALQQPEADSADQPAKQLWAVAGAKDLDAVRTARDARTAREQAEHNRLLYVAMTRARDRLIVAGYQTGSRARPKGCWYDTIFEALEPHLTEAVQGDGRRVWRIASEQEVAATAQSHGGAELVAPQSPPDWARSPAPAEPQRAIPVAPSKLAPLDTDETGEPAPFQDVRSAASPAAEQATPSPRSLGRDNRFLRGTLTHALLEHLPGHPQDRWEAAAEGFVASRGSALSAAVRASIVKESLAVLHDPSFGALFGPASRAEVPVVAELSAPEGEKGPPLRINGQIDRLVRLGDELLILDYKTNRPPPLQVDGVAETYVLQLAAYRLALRRIYPGVKVTAAILWTDGCNLMPIPDDLLTAHEARLWALGARRLDAA
ncbi:MAG: double-strand break repair helicase AddA [Hyphomicrobiaceae bacterium]|nr:double-strand break repair helicase AddA [Hyphomicrobiaceae bacterium]